MRSCENCVNHKVYPYKNSEAGWHSLCTGVTTLEGDTKRSEWLEDVSVANDCAFYDEDSWVK